MKREPLKPVSPDRKYGLEWDWSGEIIISLLEEETWLVYLVDNYPNGIEKAVFSRDMRRILCLNLDGSVGVWSMPSPKTGRAGWTKNIVDFLLYRPEEDSYTLRKRQW